MLYECENCQRRFEFGDHIVFCPYCGKALNESISTVTTTNPALDLLKAMDSIWGDRAKAKDDYKSVISDCIDRINTYAEMSIRSILTLNDLSQFKKNYSNIKRSNNRKTLIKRVESYVDFLGAVIDSLSDQIPPDIIIRLENTAKDASKMTEELYNIIEINRTDSKKAWFTLNEESKKVRYTREQLQDLYCLVCNAYEKYKKCVEDNNMFAAFSSESDYGTMRDYWSRWPGYMHYEDGEIAQDDQEVEDTPKYDQVMNYMRQNNNKLYDGLLDEDFVPHVDAFWYGLQMLCSFIDGHINIEIETSRFFIDSDEQSKLMRTVSWRGSEVTESKFDDVFELRDKFGEKIKTLREVKDEE